jgi:DNA polymerase-3 subunit epsilon/ATP-dependent DNA helicase DinG
MAPPAGATPPPAGDADLDVWRLAGLLVPGLGRGERSRLSQELGIPLAAREPAIPEARLAERAAIIDACRARLATLELPALQGLARILAGSRLAEALLVQEIFRERARSAFGGAAEPDGRTGREADVEALVPPPAPGPALQPARDRKPIDPAWVQRALAPGGAVAAVLRGYEPRPGQMKMAQAVAKALNERLHLVVEAGTGTGKSLAYLIPAVEYAVANGRRVVISTNTINLQEQLFFKDIPLVRQALPEPFRAAVLKGRANYLCLRRWRAFLREGLATDADRLLAAKILLWLRQTETGDRSELALDDYEAARWATSLAADALHCTPQLCRDHRLGRCFLARARRRAEGAHLLVVNHALLLADQALESKVLPEYGDLIIDEAHHLEDVATDQLGAEAGHQELAFLLAAISQQQGPGRYAGLVARAHTALITAGGAPMRQEASQLTQPAHDAVEEARRALADFFAAVGSFVRALAEEWGPVGYGERAPSGERDIRLTGAVRASEWWSGVETAWEPFEAALGKAAGALARVHEALEPYQGSSDLVDDTLADLASAEQQLSEVRVDLDAMVASPRADQVSWVAVRERGTSLRCAPLAVGPLLQQQLFSQKDCVVLTSATIQVGGSFRHIRERLGLAATTYTLAVPSPFDYASQALLCVPDDLPDPASRGFADAAHEALVQICTATGGRTLVLFTSHAALRAAHEQLRRRLRGLVVLGQGLDGPRQQLLQRFRETPNAVLLGTSSFWEGIDVVGDALSCLVIVKLPFSVPSDPVFAARSELYEDPFNEYALPQAILRLKQGFGRLIRSTTDRGVVAILDCRVFAKRYGESFLRSLPPATRRRCSARELGSVIQSWLAGKRGALPL